MNGGSTQSLTTDLVIEILTERGYPVAQILPKPRVKRYSRTEVEQLIAIKVQEAVQDREEHLLAALERSRYLEAENERLMTRLRSLFGKDEASPLSETTVEVTPITAHEREQPDIFEEGLELWKVSFSVGERVRIVDNTNNDDYGKTGIIKGQSKSDLALWWVQLSNGDYKQFPALVLESLPPSFDEERASMPISKQIVQKLKKIEQVPIAG
jgi:antitoxin (DNA-binding transcriptional repressor) of toxin-antitoxin stability system